MKIGNQSSEIRRLFMKKEGKEFKLTVNLSQVTSLKAIKTSSGIQKLEYQCVLSIRLEAQHTLNTLPDWPMSMIVERKSNRGFYLQKVSTIVCSNN